MRFKKITYIVFGVIALKGVDMLLAARKNKKTTQSLSETKDVQNYSTGEANQE